MDYVQFAKLVAGIENGTVTEISEDQGYSLIDVARQTGTPLSGIVKAKISAAFNLSALPGWERYVDGTGKQVRLVARKVGTRLPSESGDNTP